MRYKDISFLLQSEKLKYIDFQRLKIFIEYLIRGLNSPWSIVPNFSKFYLIKILPSSAQVPAPTGLS